MRGWILMAVCYTASAAFAEAPEQLPPIPPPAAAPSSPQTLPAPAPNPAAAPSPSPLPAPLPKITGDIQASYLKSTGASRQETIKGLLDTRYVREPWTYELKTEVLNETDSLTGAHTRERYLVIEKTSWNFTPRDFLFVKPQFEKDKQSFYDYQALLTTGYGHQFYKTEKLLLTLDAGAGIRHSKDRISRDHDEDLVANTSVTFEWMFRPGGRLTENASVEGGKENTIARSRTALRFTLTGVIGFFVAYDTKHDDSSATADDTLLTIGLSYRLK